MTTVAQVAPDDRRRLFELTSLLLTYPDAELVGSVGLLSTGATGLEHPQVRRLVGEFLGWFATSSAEEIERHYVETFDLRRRSGLYLTYYLHGDTRKRGVALVALKSRYRAHGLTLRGGELPDLLPVVLEYAALLGPGEGEAPLRQHRRGLELLRAAVGEAGSPYAALLEAIVIALPPLTEADRAAVAALAVEGPPVEAVGLAPYRASRDELAAVGAGPAITNPDGPWTDRCPTGSRMP